MGRILSIDFGAKRVGIAVTDILKIIASPLTTVENRNIFPFLKEYCQKEEVETFVVGYPFNNDKDTDSSPLIRTFIKRLKKEFQNIPVKLVDESFTSKEAVQSMVIGGVKKKKRREKALVDKISATLILQIYMKNNE